MNFKFFLSKLYISILFYVSLLIVFVLFLFFTNQAHLLFQGNLLHWDAIHYFNISKDGYNEEYLTAFFPLFPLVWKMFSFSALAVSVFNAIVFSISIATITYHYKINFKEHLLLLSIPSLFFMFIPYTEALFFLFGTIVIIGLNKNSILLIALGLFFSSIVRPTAYVFIPAILIMEYITKISIRDFLKRSLIFSFIIFLGLFTTVLIQYLSTNKWFVFFEAQKGWGNILMIPKLPLTSWAGGAITMLDGTALLVGVVSFYMICKIFISYYQEKQATKVSKTFLFSLLYLVGVALIVLLFRGGSLFSLNRFIYASPYFILCFYYWIHIGRFKIHNTYVLFIGISLYWLLFASYVHIQTLGKFELLTLYLLLPFLLIVENNKWKSNSYYYFISLNILLQVYFMYRFLEGNWVG